MDLAGVLLLRAGPADDGLQDDERRLAGLGLGGLDGGVQLLDVLDVVAGLLPVDRLDVPVEGVEALESGEALGGEGGSKGKETTGIQAEGDTGAALPQTALPSPTKPAAIDYSAMPLDRLRALDKARDATLSFLLTRIDKAEADLKALGEEPARPP